MRGIVWIIKWSTFSAMSPHNLHLPFNFGININSFYGVVLSNNLERLTLSQACFLHWFWTDGFSLVSKWQQIFQGLRTRLRIVADLNTVVAWIASILHLISCTLRFLSRPLRTVPKGTYYNWYQHHVHIPLFIYLFILVLRHGLSTCLSFCFLLLLTLWDGKIH